MAAAPPSRNISRRENSNAGRPRPLIYFVRPYVRPAIACRDTLAPKTMLVIAAERASHNNDGALTYGFGELDELIPAYAATIHKEPGLRISRRDHPFLTQHYAMLQ
jgi:hypothetical protein